MLKIYINYDSKMSFSSKRDSESYLTSMGVLKENENKNAKEFIVSENSFLENMSAIKKRFPNFDYQGIQKQTVLGVLCRLIGDVRRLDDLDNDHFVLSKSNSISFTDTNKEFQSETLLLHTPLKEVQGSSAGIISKNHFLQDKNSVSLSVLSVLNVQNLNEALSMFVKLKNRDQSVLNDVYIGETIHPRLVIDEMLKADLWMKEKTDKEMVQEFFLENGHVNTSPEGVVEAINIKNVLGVLLNERIKYLIDFNKYTDVLLQEGLLSRSKNITGIASGSGFLTVKDFFTNFVSDKKMSWTMPYQMSLQKECYFEKDIKKPTFNANAKLGVVKECGELIIRIDQPQDICKEFVDYIQSASVGSFQLGKKGLAYIKKIEGDFND